MGTFTETSRGRNQAMDMIVLRREKQEGKEI
jgi:hypothetical protein